MLRRLLARNPRRGAAAGLLALAAVSAGGLALSSSGDGSSLPTNEAISIPDTMRQLLSWSSKFLPDFSLPSFSSVSPPASRGRDSSTASASPGFTEDDVPLGRKSIVKAAAAVGPAVVNFLDPRGGDKYFADSIGSGTIIDPDGTILTCAQCVADVFNAPMASKGKVFVTLQDGRDFGGTVVNVDFSSDIALVKIQSETPLPAAKLGSSSKLQPGDFVIALGCPLLLKDTITSGIVSSVDRTNSDAGIEGIQREFLQTDCAINVGNCGGPLVNLDGEVVGVNITQIHESDRLSFAMPIDWVIKVVEQLKKKGRVVHPWLGAKMVALTQENIAILKEKDASFPDVKQGVLLGTAIRESPADRAGFRLGDVIVEFDGKPVGSVIEILSLMEDQAGKPLKALVKRTKDESVTLTVVPEEVDMIRDTSHQ